MEKTIHEGRNVKRLREILGVKQDALAFDLGLSQQSVSLLEQKETLDKEVLEKIAVILKVPADAIKNFNEEAAISFINNTYNDNAASYGHYYNFNPLDKLMEALEENKRLYEERLKDKDEMIATLQKILAENS